MKNDKETLRREALRLRAETVRHPDDGPRAARLFLENIPVSSGCMTGLYWPKSAEFDSTALMDALLERGHACALPVMQGASRILRFARWRTGDALAAGPFAVMQPAGSAETEWVEPDIVVVPFLAFDRRGARLGYGGGYYDATLRYLRKTREIKAVGLGWAWQESSIYLPLEPQDEKVDEVVTPESVIKCINF